jgi:hypothetical protein
VKRVSLIGSLVGALAVGSYAWLASGRPAAALFLGLAAATLVTAVALLLGAAAALGREPVAAPTPTSARRRRELEREKQRLLKALKELEFDHEMGKISEADFSEIGGVYRVRALRVYRQLDADGGDYRALVERDLKQRLGTAAPPSPSSARERPRCPCGTVNDHDAAFCKRCGRPLAASEKVV